MKNIILNNVKKSLSVTLALALLTISLFTGVSLNIKAAETQENIIYWDGTKTAPDETNVTVREIYSLLLRQSLTILQLLHQAENHTRLPTVLT